MKRIVHGHYADPDSTRDIIGITHAEFETMITALQHYHKSMELLLSSTPEERKLFFEAGLASMIDDPECTADKIEDAMRLTEEKNINHYNTSYEILSAINQPYPGAEY